MTNILRNVIIKLSVAGFVWDKGNAAKCEKHGLSRSEVEQFFTGELQLVGDVKHSQIERRLIAVGYGPHGRPMLVVFVLRNVGGTELVRPISARFMHANEAAKYEKAHPKTTKR